MSIFKRKVKKHKPIDWSVGKRITTTNHLLSVRVSPEPIDHWDGEILKYNPVLKITCRNQHIPAESSISLQANNYEDMIQDLREISGMIFNLADKLENDIESHK